MATTKIQSGAFPADVVTTAAIDDASVTHAKLHTTMDLSSKTVTLPSAITDTITNKLPLAGGTLTGALDLNGGLDLNADYNITEYYKADTTTRLGYLLFRDDGPNYLEFNDTDAGQDFRFASNNSSIVTIKSDGKVGIGTTNPLTKLHAQVSNVSGYTSVQNDGIVIERTGGTAALNIATDVDQTGAIWFGDATDADAGGIFYQHNADRMIFRVAAGSRVKINSQGVIEGASDAEIKTSPIRKHSNTISTNTTIDSSENAIASGPISIATGVTLTINGNMTVV